MEVALGQAPVVLDLLRAVPGWEALETVPDLAGVERVVLARSRGVTGSPSVDETGKVTR